MAVQRPVSATLCPSRRGGASWTSGSVFFVCDAMPGWGRRGPLSAKMAAEADSLGGGGRDGISNQQDGSVCGDSGDGAGERLAFQTEGSRGRTEDCCRCDGSQRMAERRSRIAGQEGKECSVCFRQAWWFQLPVRRSVGREWWEDRAQQRGPGGLRKPAGNTGPKRAHAETPVDRGRTGADERAGVPCGRYLG